MSDIEKVLVVDDSELMQKMYRLVFSRFRGCSLVPALNGLEALEILEKDEGFDFILLDMAMPVMDGESFLEHKRQRGLGRQIPIIAIAAKDGQAKMRNAVELGAIRYLVKPFKPHELYSILEKSNISNRYLEISNA